MIIIPAVLTTYKCLKDRSLVLTFETGEPTPEQIVNVAMSVQYAGFLAFNKDAFKTAQLQIIEETKADYDDQTKTPAKRLRGVLYVAWEQNKEGFESFENYYIFKMDKFIEHVKKQLNKEF